MPWLSRCTRWLKVGSPRRPRARSGARPLVLEHLEDRCVPAISISEFSNGITQVAGPYGIVAGPGGNLWFTEFAANKIASINPTTGAVTEYSVPTATSGPQDITVGPDGNLWFTEFNAGQIGRFNPTTAAFTEFANGITPNSQPFSIVAGPDGNLWFTEFAASQIARITTSGVVTEFGESHGISQNSGPFGITTGPDGNLWFTENSANQIGSFDLMDDMAFEYGGLAARAHPQGITTGPDGNLWFTENGAGPNQNGQIGRITPTGTLTEFGGITGGDPRAIVLGPDANLWFTEGAGNRIGSITPAGVVTEYSNGLSSNSMPQDITLGPDANLWFTEFGGSRIGRVQGIPAATTTALTTSDSTPVYGETLVFTATVGAQVAGVTPPSSGVVVFRDGGRVMGAAALAGGMAVFSTDTLSAGTHQITASYIANTKYAGSTSPAVSESIGAADTSTTVSGPGAASTYGQVVALTATVGVTDAVSDATPAGAVGFYDGATLLGTAPLSGGLAVFTTSRLAAGDHPNVTATYYPTANFKTSSSQTPADALVYAASTSISITSAANPVTAGQLVTYSATVSAVNSPATPTGYVTFSDGNTVLGVSTLSGGLAVLSTVPTMAGDHTISATYTPTANFLPTATTAATALTEHVNPGAAAQILFGQQPTFSFVNTPFIPTVTVSFVDSYGNPTTYTGYVSIALANNPTAASLGGMNTALPSNGVAAFPGVYVTKTGAGYTLSANSPGLASAISSPFTIGSATHFSVAAPTTIRAGMPFSLNVTALNPLGGVDSLYQGTVTITSNDPSAQTLLASYTFTAADQGRHTFPGLILRTATPTGHPWTITVTDSRKATVTGKAMVSVLPLTPTISHPLTPVTAPSATHFSVAGPSSVLAGTGLSLTVSALNASGSLVPQYQGTVTITATNGMTALTLLPSYTFTAADKGRHSFTALALAGAGHWTIAVTDVDQPNVLGRAMVAVTTPPPATHFGVAGPTSVMAGAGFSLTVTAQTASNALAGLYQGTVAITATNGITTLTLLPSYAFATGDNGRHVFTSLDLPELGRWTITVTDTGKATVLGRMTVTATAPLASHVKAFRPVSLVHVLYPFRGWLP